MRSGLGLGPDVEVEEVEGVRLRRWLVGISSVKRGRKGEKGTWEMDGGGGIAFSQNRARGVFGGRLGFRRRRGVVDLGAQNHGFGKKRLEILKIRWASCNLYSVR